MTKPAKRSAPATPRNVDKSVEKSRVPAQLKPFKPGIDARRGRGPAKGAPNAGRPPNEWKQSLRALADREAVLSHVDAALSAGPRRPKLDEAGKEVVEFHTDGNGRSVARVVMEGSLDFQWALEYATEHGYGRAAQSVDLTTAGEKLPSTQTIVIGGRTIAF